MTSEFQPRAASGAKRRKMAQTYYVLLALRPPKWPPPPLPPSGRQLRYGLGARALVARGKRPLRCPTRRSSASCGLARSVDSNLTKIVGHRAANRRRSRGAQGLWGSANGVASSSVSGQMLRG
jgi:hypothetical protein